MTTPRPHRALVTGAALLLSLALAPLATAQEARTLFAFSVDNPASLLAHEKDRGLARTLALLPERIEEVVHVFAGPEQAALARQALVAMGRPMRIGVTVAPPAEEGAPPAIAGSFIVEFDNADSAQALADTLTELLFLSDGLLEAPVESDAHPGMLEAPSMGGMVRWGAQNLDGANATVLTVGELTDIEAPYASLTNAPGDVIGRAVVDIGAISGFLLPMVEQAMADEEGPIAVFIERARDLLADPPVWRAILARAGGAMVYEGRVVNFAESAAAWGVSTDEGLTADHLAPFPLGASAAAIGYADLAAYWDALAGPFTQMPEVAEVMEQVETELGADIRDDILPAFGPTFGYYTSMGGVGAASPTYFTFVAQIRDRDTVKVLMDRATEAINNELLPASEALMGLATVQIRTHEAEGAHWYALEGTGLPIPLAPTFVLTDDWLVFALSPSSARAAAMQAMGRGMESLAAQPAIAQAIAAGPTLELAWLDSPTLAPGAFMFADIFVNALAMGVKSPAFPERDAGVVMPTYQQWNEGVQPTVSITQWDGDDLVQRAVMDGSLLVTGTTSAKATGYLWYMFMQAGILLPALEEARASARGVQDIANMNTIHQACLAWAVENDGAFPDSFDTLVHEGFLDQSQLSSPFGPVTDGGGDYLFRLGEPDMLGADPNAIIGYSRAAAAAGHDDIAVVYGDGSVFFVFLWDLLDEMETPPNDSVNWNVPGFH